MKRVWKNVLFACALCALMVLANVAHQLGYAPSGSVIVSILLPHIDAKSKARIIQGDLQNLGRQVGLYALDHGDTYPPTLDHLLEAVNGVRPYLSEPAMDPWGNPYNYTPGTTIALQDHLLWSSGRDGVSGNADDLPPFTQVGSE